MAFVYKRFKYVYITLGIMMFAVTGCQVSPKQENGEFPQIHFSSNDRVLILAPHPDDEMITCGGVSQEAMKKNLPVRIVFLTYGDNNQWAFLVYRKHPVFMPKAVQGMGLLRHDEAIAATKKIGLSADHLTFLGYPDFRTLEIWYSHWGDRLAAESMLTQVKAVPYLNALRPGAAYKGDEILKDLKTVIQEFKPTKIFLSHPSDHNPDHQSLYLFTRVALWDIGAKERPALYPYLVHYFKWPQPAVYNPQAEILPPAFLKGAVEWKTLNLTQAEVANKHQALQEHRSQYQSSPQYLRLFMRSNELFGDFPVVTLREGPSSVALDAYRNEDLDKGSEQLLDSERAAFVGVESTSVELKEGKLVFTFKLSRPLGEEVGFSIYAFGYKKAKVFAQMPKIHIQFGAVGHKILDQDKLLDKNLVGITRTAKEITVRIPLAILDNPDRVLTSARTYIGNVPLDWVAWRVLELSN